ncbi:cytokinin riboside 5'-monophosphate phosphoribohydrolase [Companilactobacillus sp. RD055328]|uniref:LOG family protein n=1 Tax=Companilactobacillus sp. RD055328 TaxID=2916634 RepID=UPI001FC7E1D9|nr:TIGR00730 family Rossman fold protein [Companilactobacillus sp. RD055328]GKQ43197.1 cytokinin riboside 5'-monophosphate phosphoribohydrolase [Companilactobacillus sp. RD055328]
MTRIAVYCGASTGFDNKYAQKAEELAQWMCTNGYDLVYGGGNRGLMGIIADTMLANGRQVFGVIPGFLVEDEQAHEGLTSLEIVEDMDERKKKMLELSDYCLALPGGPGTIEEISEAYSWNRVGQNNNPCILFNQDGYYEPLIEMYDRMVEQGFLTKEHREMLYAFSSFSEIKNFIND